MADGFKRQKIKCRWRWKMGKLYWVRLMGGIAGYYCSSIGLICRFKKRSLKTGKQMSSNELSSRKIAVFTALSCFRPIEHPLERISWSLLSFKALCLNCKSPPPFSFRWSVCARDRWKRIDFLPCKSLLLGLCWPFFSPQWARTFPETMRWPG